MELFGFVITTLKYSRSLKTTVKFEFISFNIGIYISNSERILRIRLNIEADFLVIGKKQKTRFDEQNGFF
jgi:hypothetical protein